MQQLTGVDASFLYLETGATVGHVCGVALPDPTTRDGELTFDAVRTVVEQRHSLLPPLRRRLVEVPFGIDRPYWADDPDFDLDFHVRELALPAPGSKGQLCEQVARIASRPLDRHRPLWALYLPHDASGRRPVVPGAARQADTAPTRALLGAAWGAYRRMPGTSHQEVAVMTGSPALHVDGVMTREVVTATRETGFRDAVRLLTEKRVGALPVVDGDRLVGILTQSDLLLKEEASDRPDPMAGRPWQRHRSRLRASATSVGAAMSQRPWTVAPTATLSDAAHLMHRHGVGVLPVVDGEKRLVGIVTRSDLLRVFLRDDADLLADVERAVAPAGDGVRCSVADGCVTLDGSVRYLSQAGSASAAARHVPGVVDVRCSVRAEVDDVHSAMMGP